VSLVKNNRQRKKREKEKTNGRREERTTIRQSWCHRQEKEKRAERRRLPNKPEVSLEVKKRKNKKKRRTNKQCWSQRQWVRCNEGKGVKVLLKRARRRGKSLVGASQQRSPSSFFR